MLSVATLDDDPGVGPFKHIWVSHDAPWLRILRWWRSTPSGILNIDRARALYLRV